MVWEVQSGGSDANGSGGFRGGALVAVPSAPTVVADSGASVAGGTYYCVITYFDAYGETGKSAETSVVVNGTSNKGFTVTSPPQVAGACAWALYCGTTSGGPYWLQGSPLSIGTNRGVSTTPPTSGVQVPGTDRSQQTTTQVNIDNSTITTSITASVITFTGYTPTAADVGNTVRMLTGTNVTAGVYEIIAFTGTTWTVTGAAALPTSGTTTNATGKMGGCLATPGAAMVAATGGNKVWIKAGTYTCSSSSNVAGGRLTPPGGADSRPTGLFGYSATRGDFGTKPVLRPSGASTTLITASADLIWADNIEFQANAQTGAVGVNVTGSYGIFRRLKANTLATGFTAGGTGSQWIDCLAIACTANQWNVTAAGNQFYGCVSQNPGTAIHFWATSIATGTIWDRCVCSCAVASVASIAVSANSRGCCIRNCVVFNSTGSGIQCGPDTIVENTIVSSCSGAQGGITNASSSNPQSAFTRNCAIWNCSPSTTLVCEEGSVTLTADPFTNAAGGDFSLNTTAGGGAACRAAGIPSSFPGLSTSSYPDIGAAQHADPAASGGGPRIHF